MLSVAWSEIKISIGVRERSDLGHICCFCLLSESLCAISPSAEIAALLFSSVMMPVIWTFVLVYLAKVINENSDLVQINLIFFLSVQLMAFLFLLNSLFKEQLLKTWDWKQCHIICLMRKQMKKMCSCSQSIVFFNLAVLTIYCFEGDYLQHQIVCLLGIVKVIPFRLFSSISNRSELFRKCI